MVIKTVKLSKILMENNLWGETLTRMKMMEILKTYNNLRKGSKESLFKLKNKKMKVNIFDFLLNI